MPSVVPTTPAKTTAVKPTIIDTLAPKIKRDSTSRPSWSVPSRYWVLPPVCQNGGLKRAARLPTSGLWGASTFAKIAMKATPTRIKVGMKGKSPSRREVRRHRKRAARAMVSAWVLIGALPLQPDARIDHGVQYVDEQIHRYDHGAAHYYDALNHREVAERNAFVEQPPDAGPRKYGLYDNGHIDHDHKIDSGQCQHRNERVFECVLGDDQGFGQPLYPGELDIFRAQHVEHRGARQAHMGGSKIPAERKGRHDQVQRRAGARGRQPAEINREHQNQDQADPEGGQRQAQQREQFSCTVPKPPDPHRRKDAARNTDQQGQAHRNYRQNE